MNKVLKKWTALLCAAVCGVGCVASLAACQDKGMDKGQDKESGKEVVTEVGKEVTVYMPDGAPALAMAGLMYEDKEDDGVSYYVTKADAIASTAL